MSEQLLPCPFCHCGTNALSISGDEVICGHCGATAELDVWNRRAEPEPAQSDVETVEQIVERVYQWRGMNMTYILPSGGHADCYRETCDAFGRDLLAILSQVRAEERERCAKVCENFSINNEPIHPDIAADQMSRNARIVYHSTAQSIAAAIRKGEP